MLLAALKKPLYTPVDNIVDTLSELGNGRWHLALLESGRENSEKFVCVVKSARRECPHDLPALKRAAQGPTEISKNLSTCATVFLWICA